MRGESSLHDQVSAHMGESTVVGVTRRSERRTGHRSVPGTAATAAATGFSLVSQRSSGEMAYGSSADARALGGGYEPRRSNDGTRDAGGGRPLDLERMRERGTLYTRERDERGYGVRGILQTLAASLASIPQMVASGLLGFVGRIRVGGLLVVATIALAVFMLYAPLRDMYVANRRLDYLQETYDALLAENAALQSELELLQTREGIENEARARGYVEEGETKVVVDGLPEVEAQDLVASRVSEEELPDNRTWSTRMLDQLFGYEPGA